jgi:hypothetical protein
VSHEHKARIKRGGKNMPWKSEIWASLELDFGSDQETVNPPQAEAWIDRIVGSVGRRPSTTDRVEGLVGRHRGVARR